MCQQEVQRDVQLASFPDDLGQEPQFHAEKEWKRFIARQYLEAEDVDEEIAILEGYHQGIDQTADIVSAKVDRMKGHTR